MEGEGGSTNIWRGDESDKMTSLDNRNTLSPVEDDDDNLSPQERPISVTTLAPSIKERNKLAALRKEGCSFKLGCLGVKYVVTEKKWCMRKDGTYGYKYLRKANVNMWGLRCPT